jgi:Transposase DNA-binding
MDGDVNFWLVRNNRHQYMQAEEEQEDRDWAEHELGIVELGDKRLTSRLVTLARSLARAPELPLPQALPQ